jgi:hypothetical protein
MKENEKSLELCAQIAIEQNPENYLRSLKRSIDYEKREQHIASLRNPPPTQRKG